MDWTEPNFKHFKFLLFKWCFKVSALLILFYTGKFYTLFYAGTYLHPLLPTPPMYNKWYEDETWFAASSIL